MNELTVEFRSYPKELQRHRHDFHQLILPCSGALEIEIERHDGRVGGSIASFVPAGCNHAFRSSREDIFLVMDVPAGRICKVLDEEVVPPFFVIGPETHSLIDYMLAVGRQEAALSKSVLTAWSTLLLDRLARESRSPDRVELALRRAVAFMKRRLADPISVRDIAEAARMSQSRLHDAFSKRRAISPHAQLVSLRLNAAEEMLADPHLTIAEIAFRTGHSDQSALTRTMRRERGATPAEVRRRLL